MKAINLLFVCTLFLIDTTFAQPELIWYKLYTYVNLQDYPYKMAIDSNKNIYIVGITEVSNDPQTNFDALIIKYDSLGNLKWTRRHSLSATGFYDAFTDLLVCDSGKVLVSGSLQIGMTNRLVSIMYGPNGDTVWNKTYQQQGGLEWEFNTTRTIFNDFNSNFVITDYVIVEPYSKLLIVKYDHNGQNQEVHYSDILIGGPPTDIQVIKRDSIYIYATYSKEVAPYTYLPAIIKFNEKGNKVWETMLLDTTITFRSSKILIDDSLNVFSIFHRYEFDDTTSYLAKLDPQGKILWKKLFKVKPEEGIRPWHLIQKNDKTLYIIGSYTRQDTTGLGPGYFLLKYDQDGNLLLSQKELQNRTVDQIRAVKVSSDQNLYILLRSRISFMHLGDFHMVKYDTEDRLEYELIYDYQNWGSRAEDGVDFALIGENDFVITGGGGPGILRTSIVTTRFSTEPLSVNDLETGHLYLLNQNYPNPFNPSTKITFSIAKLTYVTIKVYDVLGNEIQTLISEEISAGNYSVEFNGSSLSSGIYFYRIITPEFSQIRKMVLIK